LHIFKGLPLKLNTAPRLHFVLFTLAVFWLASPSSGAQNPQPEPASVELGKSIFRKSCGSCHGDNAKGGRAPDLTQGTWKHGGSDEEISRNIRNGIGGTQMPGFVLDDDELKAIMAFLRSVQSQPTDEAPGGNLDVGRQLFFGSAQCSRCHMVHGEGGRLGPDLTRIARTRKADDLRKAIREPGDTLREGFATVELEFANGRKLRGAARNEDTFSIQVMDAQEKIHLLLKKDLKRLARPPVSLMPKLSLDAGAVGDLVAFLSSSATQLGSSANLPAWKPASDLNVSFDRLRNAEREPHNWLTYWGDYQGRHYSHLRSITPTNIGQLRSEWTYLFSGSNIEVTPLVVDGLMFVTGPASDATALDARTGRTIWRYVRPIPEGNYKNCTVVTNRGLGILGDRLYLGTLDGYLVALDAKTGNVVWEAQVADYREGFSITHAPLVIDGRVIVGITSGECALQGFVDAYDAATGARLWRFWTIPRKDNPARATWDGNSAEFGGAPTWMTGTYDAEARTLFWTVGNPGPDYDGSVRAGDNLYTCSVVALDPEIGTLKWHFQFTPHDTHDWDANETPVLIDDIIQGRRRKLLIQANRNGFYYVLDRTTGEFLLGKAFANQTWADGLDTRGRPIVKPNTDPTPSGTYVCPSASGNTNWCAPSFSPLTRLFYVSVLEECATYFSETKPPVPGQGYTGGGQQLDIKIGSPGAIRALDPRTGETVWDFKIHQGSHAAGVLGTAGSLVFAGTRDGYLIGLHAKTGKELWRYQTGAQIMSSPISYEIDGRQFVAIANSGALLTFALPPAK
jgi:PQQ-dependent dehydrogenase (methanol/ethanol family)